MKKNVLFAVVIVGTSLSFATYSMDVKNQLKKISPNLWRTTLAAASFVGSGYLMTAPASSMSFKVGIVGLIGTAAFLDETPWKGLKSLWQEKMTLKKAKTIAGIGALSVTGIAAVGSAVFNSQLCPGRLLLGMSSLAIGAGWAHTHYSSPPISLFEYLDIEAMIGVEEKIRELEKTEAPGAIIKKVLEERDENLRNFPKVIDQIDKNNANAQEGAEWGLVEQEEEDIAYQNLVYPAWYEEHYAPFLALKDHKSAEEGEQITRESSQQSSSRRDEFLVKVRPELALMCMPSAINPQNLIIIAIRKLYFEELRNKKKPIAMEELWNCCRIAYERQFVESCVSSAEIPFGLRVMQWCLRRPDERKQKLKNILSHYTGEGIYLLPSERRLLYSDYLAKRGHLRKEDCRS